MDVAGVGSRFTEAGVRHCRQLSLTSSTQAHSNIDYGLKEMLYSSVTEEGMVDTIWRTQWRNVPPGRGFKLVRSNAGSCRADDTFNARCWT